MKRILLALATLALLLPSAPRAEARVNVSIDFFYNHLDGGSWIEVGDYGYCWQPGVAVSNRNWRPYSDGYWAYTDLGWTWVSYEDFGWATYHYGRWARLRDHGWVWVPGYEWGPAWVSWRTGGDYVGWAPLPPRRRGYGGAEVVYEGRPITGYVDIEFDIGPAYYNFVDIRYIGAPVLREHIYEPSRNVTYINQTVNVTNITYNNSTVYNYGPDYNTLSAYSARPIQRLTLERQTPTDLNAAVQSGALTRVQGDKLVVAAPAVVEKPQQPVAPRDVKTKVEQPNIETGWMGITDPNAKAQIQEKMKKEDRKSVPPPQIAPKNPEALNAAAQGAGSGTETTTTPTASDVAAAGTAESKLDRKGKGNDKRGRDNGAPVAQQEEADGATPPQPADAAAAAGANEQRGRGNRNKDRGGRDQNQPSVPPQPPAAGDPAVTGAPDAGAAPAVQDRGRGRGNRAPQLPPSAPPAAPADAAANTGAADAPAASSEKERGGRGNRDRQRDEINGARGNRPADPQPAPQTPERGPDIPGAAAPNDADAGGRGRGKQKRERVDVPPQQGPGPDVAPPPQAPAREMMQERPRGRRERQEPPAEIAPPPQAPPREMRQERGRGGRERQEMPPQMAPPPQAGPAAGAPPPQPEGRGKPERKKKKDGEEP